MRPLARESVLSALFFVAIAIAGCGGSADGSGEGGTGGSGGEGGAGGTGGASDPCGGKACGDPCSTCPPGAPCAQQTCDASGACVFDVVVCEACPSFAPPDGEACPTVGLVCEMDEGIVLSCRARVTCTANGWENTQPGCSSQPPDDPNCPMSPPMGNCDVMTDAPLCGYTDTVCGCSNCLGGPCGGQAQWVCAAPPAAPCPPIAPKLGASCDAEGQKCTYGACPLGGTSGGRTCSNGIWLEDIVGCPL